jgi:hypothetical protein
MKQSRFVIAGVVKQSFSPLRNESMITKILRCTQYTFLLALLTGLSLATAACGQRITVYMAEPLESALETEDLQLRNCDCDTEMVSTVEIQKKMDIEDYARSGSQDNKVLIPPEIMAELVTELELAYEPVYEQAKTAVGQIRLTVPADMIRAYQIERIAQSYNSTISFRMGLKAYTTAYTYELRIPEESGFIEIPCTP